MKLTVEGREAYAYTGGKPFDAALPCVVFIHGAMNDHSVWTLLARYFAHHGRSVLAVDLPGHGRSEGPALADVESLGAWIQALLDAAQVRAAAFVGHSMGSLIALEAASREPARCERLVMVGTAWPMKVSDALLATAREQPEAAMRMVNAFSHSTTAAKPSYPGPGAWLHGGALALMERMQQGYAEHGNLFEHDFLVCDRYQRAPEAAARVAAPVHLVLGSKDAMTPPKAAQALAEMLKAKVHWVPAGHALMGEAPEAVLGVLKGALAVGAAR
ncbi:alpha/beta fold hydrolase [Roseateles amylovorans]|uniref:Alpha/beta hydrolase n=1 Tax=Roseateles amylovorans TaxID=2978473 RepID=A0ABY6AW72_9BURK|nr:alpha/beta hydrolase [Roseateles amylovorans]UXH76845.1 alpha/beta hydrolase [Roseateles amylovorans]